MIRNFPTALLLTAALAALAGCAQEPAPSPYALAPSPCRQAVPDAGCWPPGLYVYPPLEEPGVDTGPYTIPGLPIYPPLVIGGKK